jgi:hypothetical protein
MMAKHFAYAITMCVIGAAKLSLQSLSNRQKKSDFLRHKTILAEMHGCWHKIRAVF